jgi:predicted CXXCH cytochrome family protein
MQSTWLETSLRFPQLAAALSNTRVQSTQCDSKSSASDLETCGHTVTRRLLPWLFLVFIFATPYARAAKHPVPLDPKADPKTCLQCHEDKAKGPHVHSAVATGCTSCHEIRVNKDTTRVKLITTTSTALCLTCHDNKKHVAGESIHPPAVRDCTKCHDPHQSPNENQLLTPTTGTTKSDNLCLTCHTQGTNTPKDGSRHPALDMGCQTCHLTHKTGDRSKRDFDKHLTKDAPALCLDCHDAKDATLTKAHQGQPFATADCLSCHDPHQSKSPKLMQAFQHMPFEGRQCDTCHSPAKDGKVVLTAADAKSICITCHADKAEQIERRKCNTPALPAIARLATILTLATRDADS